jgi:hypothetical protein
MPGTEAAPAHFYRVATDTAEVPMERNGGSLVPEGFGPLEGVRILSTGTLVAEPYAAHLAGAFGAEVIQIEHPSGTCDPSRRRDRSGRQRRDGGEFLRPGAAQRLYVIRSPPTGGGSPSARRPRRSTP